MIIEDIDVNSSDDVECPTCGDMVSYQDIGQHHYWEHNEKIRIKNYCGFCGDENHLKIGQYLRGDAGFCDRECYSNHQSENWVGENHPNYRGGKVQIECKTCGDEFKVWPGLADEREFCGKECHDKYQTGRPQKDEHDIIDVECSNCGETVQRYPSTKNEITFCTVECESEWKSKNKTGEHAYGWKGGYGDYYGANWVEQRKLARKRDGFRCQSCGLHEEDNSQELSVHHIRPFREFESAEQANELSNLVTLCESCHVKWEGIPVAPKLRE